MAPALPLAPRARRGAPAPDRVYPLTWKGCSNYLSLVHHQKIARSLRARIRPARAQVQVLVLSLGRGQGDVG